MSIPAGEQVRYTTQVEAVEIGLLPGASDFWLLDSRALLMMPFPGKGQLGDVDVTTEPGVVARARAWWDLAIADSMADSGVAPWN